MACQATRGGGTSQTRRQRGVSTRGEGARSTVSREWSADCRVVRSGVWCDEEKRPGVSSAGRPCGVAGDSPLTQGLACARCGSMARRQKPRSRGERWSSEAREYRDLSSVVLGLANEGLPRSVFMREVGSLLLRCADCDRLELVLREEDQLTRWSVSPGRPWSVGS